MDCCHKLQSVLHTSQRYFQNLIGVWIITAQFWLSHCFWLLLRLHFKYCFLSGSFTIGVSNTPRCGRCILQIQTLKMLCSLLSARGRYDTCLFLVACGMSGVASAQVIPKNFTVWVGSGIFAGFVNYPLLVTCVATAFKMCLLVLQFLILSWYHQCSILSNQMMAVSWWIQITLGLYNKCKLGSFPSESKLWLALFLDCVEEKSICKINRWVPISSPLYFYTVATIAGTANVGDTTLFKPW